MKNKNQKINVIRFNSIEEMIRDNERWGKDKTDGDSSRGRGRRDWFGTETYEEAVELMQKGWPEGASRVSTVRASLDRAVETMASAKSQEMQYGVEGEWCDIGRLAMGDPECLVSWADDGEQRPNKIIKIVANICVSGSVSTDAMYSRGAACIAAVDLLESLGYRVELWAGIGCDAYGYGNGGKLDSQVLLKDAGQPVDTDRLAYVLCHPSFFRRIYFAHMELNNMNPCGCIPCGVTADEAIVLPEACTARGLDRNALVKQIAEICRLAGVTFDVGEVLNAVKA